MSRTSQRHVLATVLAFAAFGAVGCTDNITGDAEQVGPRSPNFELAPATARGVPAGQHRILGYDVEVDASSLAPDAFQRSGSSGARIGYGGCSGLSGTSTRCWSFLTWVRDSAGDPRLPAMANIGPITAAFFAVGGPEFFGGTIKMFEIFGRLNGVAPSQPYFLSLARYGLVVNGQLDAAEKLITGVVTEPDSLVLLAPNPAGYPTVNYEWITNAGCNNNAVPVGANPLYLGPATSTSARVLTFDKCFASGNLYYKSATAVVPDSAPFFLNSLNTPKIAQQYNYIVVSEGNTPGGRVVARIQVGADIDPTTGLAIPNAFAPFPAAKLSPGVLIGQLKIAQGGPNAVTMSVLPLEPLAGSAAYQILLVNRETGASLPASARYFTITTDTTGRDELGNVTVDVDTSATTVVTTIPGAAPNVRHVIEVADDVNPGVEVKDYTDLALQPPAAANGVPIWVRFEAQGGTTTTTQDDTFFDVGNVAVGTLPLAAGASPYLFAPGGFGSGTNRGNEIGIRFEHLPRPPIGYYYNVWLVPSDPQGAPVSLGELRTPLPNLSSLRNADAEPQIDGVLTSTQILEAALLLRPSDVAALGIDPSDYATIRLTLEAKDGSPSAAPIVVLEGPFVSP